MKNENNLISKFFEPEDFGGDFGNHYTSRLDAIGAAQVANKKLCKLIESSPVVYAEKKEGFQPWYNVEFVGVTHKARLLLIQELFKVPCKHEPHTLVGLNERYPNQSTVWVDSVDFKCKHCGVKLEATWKESK